MNSWFPGFLIEPFLVAAWPGCASAFIGLPACQRQEPSRSILQVAKLPDACVDSIVAPRLFKRPQSRRGPDRAGNPRRAIARKLVWGI